MLARRSCCTAISRRRLTRAASAAEASAAAALLNSVDNGTSSWKDAASFLAAANLAPLRHQRRVREVGDLEVLAGEADAEDKLGDPALRPHLDAQRLSVMPANASGTQPTDHHW